jgi:hypothetical protein
LGRTIGLVRKFKGVDQSALAIRLGYALPDWIAIETGCVEVGTRDLERAAKALGTSTTHIVALSELYADQICGEDVAACPDISTTDFYG